MTAPAPAVAIQGQGAVNADQLNTFTQTVVNFAQLRAFTGLSNMTVQVQGAIAPGDGGQGLYYFNSSSTAADNNSTVIVPNGAIQGAWLLLVQTTFPTLTVTGAATFNGAVTMASTLAVAGAATFASDITMSGPGELKLPSGTTAQRSPTPALGMIRYNAQIAAFEGYGATGWGPLVAASATSVFPGNISGLLPSAIAGTSTTAAMTVSPGSAADSTGLAVITVVSSSWAVANGNAINGYQGGTTLPNSTTIHMFACSGTSGSGVFASSSLTPILPVGYASFFRRIFSFTTNSSGTPYPYTAIEINGGGLISYLTTPVLDFNAFAATTGSRTLYAVTVPSGVKMQWLGTIQTTAASQSLLLTSPDETDTAPGTNFTSLPTDIYFTSVNTDTPGNRRITLTNTGGQIGVRGVTSGVFNGYTFGWIDFRRT